MGGSAGYAAVSHLDIYPTLCEVLGLPKPGWLEGRSLLPVVRGDQAEIRKSCLPSLAITPPTSPSARCARSAGSTPGASMIEAKRTCLTVTTA